MMKFPMKFEVSATAKAGIGSQWTAQAGELPPIPSAIPPEFSGPGGGYSPEDLFGIAVSNCLIALYKVYCEKAKISFQHIEIKADVVIDKQPSDPSFLITEVNIYCTISGASNQDRARELFDQVAKDCPVSNSIRSGKTFHVNIL
ncbi:MAG: OsmC family protein [Chlamydiales bacterium]|nr:OsmC family protein [Chlamydiales bacterium]